MRDIARQARIRVSSLYHYFPSKDALYEAVLARLQQEMRVLMFGVMGQRQDLRALTRAAIGKLFDFLLANPAYVRLGLRRRLEGRLLFDRSVNDRWLGVMDGLIKPAEMQGMTKAVDPAFLLVTVDGLVHWHIANDPFYRDVLGKGLDDPDVVRRAREHVTQVVMRMIGLE
jgi:AcrR family transcriptional regulator